MPRKESEVAPADQAQDVVVTRTGLASTFQITCLGLCTVIGGQTQNWAAGLQGGFFLYVISTIVVGSAFLCLALCAAEMASMLPFAGGAYGYVRCALGPTMGFMAGASETMKYVLFVVVSAEKVAANVSVIGGYSEVYDLASWLVFFVFAVPLLTVGGQPFWVVCTTLGVVSLGILVLYILEGCSGGSMEPVDMSRHGGYGFLHNFAYATWFFNGVDAITVACTDAKEAQVSVPRALIATIATALVTAVCILFSAAAQAPGLQYLIDNDHPLALGFQHVLQLSLKGASALVLPSIVANALGFAFATSRQVRSMAGSGLLPRVLEWSYQGTGDNTPVAAMAFGLGVSYFMLFGLYFTISNHEAMMEELFHICLFCSCLVYISLLGAYLVFRNRYSGMERKFVSPLGVWGAYFGAAVFALIAVCVGFFKDEDYWTLTKFLGMMGATYLYYRLVAQRTEFFSKEEQEQFMKAYVVNANNEKKNRSKRRSQKLSLRLLTGLLSTRIGGVNASTRSQGSAQSSRVPGNQSSRSPRSSRGPASQSSRVPPSPSQHSRARGDVVVPPADAPALSFPVAQFVLESEMQGGDGADPTDVQESVDTTALRSPSPPL